ncbi:MAG: hypothetical protein IE933_08815 [Sphingomonadales bacterium]|nr:hypothetical protein [Sphingomonadales bacterium]MBD3773280.1 hypothetical protein [Paracoccaceae bacterium]
MDDEATKEAKRQDLIAKINAAEARVEARSVGETLAKARDEGTAFVKRHPIAAVAGAIGIGLAIGAMFPGGRRLGKKAGVKSAALAGLATEFGLAFAKEAYDKAGDAAHAGQDRLEEFSGMVSSGTRKLRKEASSAVETATDTAKSFSRRAGREMGRAMRDLRDRTTH